VIRGALGIRKRVEHAPATLERMRARIADLSSQESQARVGGYLASLGGLAGKISGEVR
jgi:hypothetical protein